MYISPCRIVVGSDFVGIYSGGVRFCGDGWADGVAVVVCVCRGGGLGIYRTAQLQCGVEHLLRSRRVAGGDRLQPAHARVSLMPQPASPSPLPLGLTSPYP